MSDELKDPIILKPETSHRYPMPPKGTSLSFMAGEKVVEIGLDEDGQLTVKLAN